MYKNTDKSYLKEAFNNKHDIQSNTKKGMPNLDFLSAKLKNSGIYNLVPCLPFYCIYHSDMHWLLLTSLPSRIVPVTPVDCGDYVYLHSGMWKVLLFGIWYRRKTKKLESFHWLWWSLCHFVSLWRYLTREPIWRKSFFHMALKDGFIAIWFDLLLFNLIYCYLLFEKEQIFPL